jgi:hypothetical protein
MGAILTDRGAPFVPSGAGLFHGKFVRRALAVRGLPSSLSNLPLLVTGHRGESAFP